MTSAARGRIQASVWLTLAISLLGVASAAGQIEQRQTPGAGNGARGINPQVRTLMQTMVKASRSLRMYGTRLVQQNVAGRMVPHTETIWMDGVRLRVEFPDPPLRGQVIVDDGTQREHLFPRRKLVRSEPSHRDNLLDRFATMVERKREPRATLSDGGQIAGVHTMLLTVYNQANQINQELWVDPRTGAILKRVGLNKTGGQVAYFEFTNVRYNAPMNDATFAIDARGVRRITLVDDLVSNAKKAGVNPLYLRPDSGYVLAGVRARKVNNIDVLATAYQGPRGRLTIMLLRTRVRADALQQKVAAGQSTYTVQRDGNTVVMIGPYSTAELETTSKLLGRP